MCNYQQLFSDTLTHHKDHTKWDEGIFNEIKKISNSKVGSVGQDFIEKVCIELELLCDFPLNTKGERANQSPWDIKINNIKFELKTATEDTNGKFQFNHIRYHRPYDAVLCLGVSPDALYFGMWSKADIATGKAGRLVSMEKGANASYKLTKSKQDLFNIELFQQKILEFHL